MMCANIARWQSDQFKSWNIFFSSDLEGEKRKEGKKRVNERININKTKKKLGKKQKGRSSQRAKSPKKYLRKKAKISEIL